MTQASSSPAPGSQRSAARTVLRERRWIVLTTIIVLLLPTFLLLARWQWHRHLWRAGINRSIAASWDAPPKPIATVLPPGRTWDAKFRYAHVVAVGTYDAAAQLLVRQRPLNSTNGFYVVTPLNLTQGGVVLVVRGWIAASGNATSTPQVSPPPSGTVIVDGWLDQPDKNPGPRPADLPAGQIQAAYPPLFGAQSQLYDALLTLTTSRPEQATDITILPTPQLDAGPHLGYMVQWICFAVLALTGWILLFRRDLNEVRAGTPDPSPDAPEPNPDART